MGIGRIAVDAVHVPESPRLSVKVPARVVPVAEPAMMTISAPAVAGKESTIVTSFPLIVPLGEMEVTGKSMPLHCDKLLDGQTSVFGAPVNVPPVCAKFV